MAAGRPGTELVQQSDANQRGRKATDGRSGQTRGFDELRTRELTIVINGGREHALEVEPPHMGGVSRVLRRVAVARMS